MKKSNKAIIIGIMFFVNLYSIFADDLSENMNDIYLNTGLFSVNYQSLSGNDIFRYSPLSGASADMIEHINLNDKINLELVSAKTNLTKGRILYWTGFAGMLATPFIAYNTTSSPEDLNMVTYFSTLGVSAIISFIGVKYLNQASTDTSRAVAIYNIVN